MLMVGGNAGLIGMSKVSDIKWTELTVQEHLGVALALNVPIAVCVTKVSALSKHSAYRADISRLI